MRIWRHLLKQVALAGAPRAKLDERPITAKSPDTAAEPPNLRESILDPVGPEFMAPPARETTRPVTVGAAQSQYQEFGGPS